MSGVNGSVSVGTSALVPVASMIVAEERYASLQVANSAGGAINGLKISGKVASGGDDILIADTAGAFTSPVAGSGVLRASGDLTALAASAKGWVMLDVTGFYSIKVEAKRATAAGIVTVSGMAKPG